MDVEIRKGDALDKSVRIALANGGRESTEDIIKRARSFDEFLDPAN